MLKKRPSMCKEYEIIKREPVYRCSIPDHDIKLKYFQRFLEDDLNVDETELSME